STSRTSCPFPTRRSSDLEAESVPSDRVIEIGKAERVAELVEPCAAPSVARGVVVLAHERVEESAHLPGHEAGKAPRAPVRTRARSEEHTSELQSRFDLVC